MKPINRILLWLTLSMMLASCAHRLVGTWNVEKYEATTKDDQSSTVSLTNIGTLRFNQNGKGEKNFDYSILGTEQKEKAPFDWSATDSSVTLTIADNEDLSKTWLIMTDKRRYQKWKSTDGTNEVQVLELRKHK